MADAGSAARSSNPGDTRRRFCCRLRGMWQPEEPPEFLHIRDIGIREIDHVFVATDRVIDAADVVLRKSVDHCVCVAR